MLRAMRGVQLKYRKSKHLRMFDVHAGFEGNSGSVGYGNQYQ